MSAQCLHSRKKNTGIYYTQIAGIDDHLRIINDY